MMPPSDCLLSSGCGSTNDSNGSRRPGCRRFGVATCWPGSFRTSIACRMSRCESSHRFAISLLVGCLTVAVMWWMLPAAGAILAVALVFAATIVPWLTGALARRRESRFAAARGDLAAAMVDLTEGAAELVAFGAAEAQVSAVRERDAELAAIATASAGTAGIGLALTTLSAGMASWCCLMVGIPAVLSGRLDETELAVITLVPLAAFEMVVGLPVASQALQRVRQAAARVFEVLDAPEPVTEPDSPDALPSPPYTLAARSVRASYPASTEAALRGVDMVLRPGRRVAIVGPSGAGKSTLAAVLLRLLECQAGEVVLNATATDRLTGEDLRTVVGLVGQDAHLFDTTVRANLAIGNLQATDDEMRAALARVGLCDWLDALPAGLSTEVGRGGAQLSGGQRQRIAVARALLADFPVLVLDEPTEHLDEAGAEALSADLLDLTGGRCTLLITHRLAGLESLDEILFLDEGRVVERGTHDELLDHDGRYAQLWSAETRRHLISDGSRT